MDRHLVYISEKTFRRAEKISLKTLISCLKEQKHIPISKVGTGDISENIYITDANLHRPGLALAGYTELFTYHRVQVFGNTECKFINSLPLSSQKEAITKFAQFKVPVLFITTNNQIRQELISILNEQGIVIFSTNLETTRFMGLLSEFLDNYFTEVGTAHGTMVDVYGVGILVVGKSGIGKSELGMDLVERGHRLVSDDLVLISKTGNTIILSPTEMNKHYMEIRGLGIIDVMRMFGVRAVRYQKRLDVIVELELWDETTHIERVGGNRKTVNIYGVPISFVRLPITPGKNLTVLAEVIALNHLLIRHGFDPSVCFQEELKKAIKNNGKKQLTPLSAKKYSPTKKK